MKKTALLFPGQGSQYVGMGKELYEKFTEVKQLFEEANDALGFDLSKICFEGPKDELTKTENTQPALLIVSVAAFKAYMEEVGVEPLYFAGHSLGEISALTCSGAIRFLDALKIVRQRGKFMQEAVAIGEGAMAAIGGVDKSVIEEECKGYSGANNTAVISNYNSPDQIVISGHKDVVEEVSRRLKESGARITPLNVSAPFHSPLMQPAADRMREELGKYTYNDLKYPVISNVTARSYIGKESIIDNLSKQIVQPVQWITTMGYLREENIDMVVETGPKTVLKSLALKNIPDISAFAFDREEDVKALKKLLADNTAKEADNTENGLKLLSRSLAITVCTRNRNWDNEEYRKGVIEPYRRVQKLLEELEKESMKPTIEQMKEALEMLRSVFVTKRTPVEEQVERFNQLFDETGTRQLFPNFIMPD